MRVSIVRDGQKLSGTAGQTRDTASPGPAGGVVHRERTRVATMLGQMVRDERRRRHLTIRDLAMVAGLGPATVSDIETGEVGSLETYVRLAEAMHLRAEFELLDPRRHEPGTRRAKDPVHSAMGEAEAAHLRNLGLQVGLDEPYQHYQFAGRGDLVAWTTDPPAMLHIENKTLFDDIQEAFGTFNSKREYLGGALLARAGVRRWGSETHVMAALWSTEVMRTIRSHQASFGSVCPDPPADFEAWWRGDAPLVGRRRTLILFDPIEGVRSDRRRWAGLADLPGLRPRYRDYEDDATELQRSSGKSS
jgi:transcriptional regulator with XRE-family HTH domain